MRRRRISQADVLQMRRAVGIASGSGASADDALFSVTPAFVRGAGAKDVFDSQASYQMEGFQQLRYCSSVFADTERPPPWVVCCSRSLGTASVYTSIYSQRRI